MKKISVIVPMYKAKEYVKGCVSSILDQDIDDYEIILVDDASPDDTYEFAKKLYEGNDKVKVIRQEKNAGPGFARNRGIDEASGEYIAFCDVDDYFVANTLKTEYDYVKEHDLDLLIINGMKLLVSRETKENLSLYGKDRFVDLNLYTEGQEYTDGPSDVKERIDNYLNRKYGWSAWGKLYKREMLNKYNIRFTSLKMAEDQLFVFESIICAKKFGFIIMFNNIYRVGNESLTRLNDNERFFVRALDASIGSVISLREKIDKNDKIKDLSSYREKLLDFQRYTIENFYTLPLYHEIGKEKISSLKEVDDIFKKYYGENAITEKEKLFSAFDNSKDKGIPIYKELTYEKYDELLKKNVKEVKTIM